MQKSVFNFYKIHILKCVSLLYNYFAMKKNTERYILSCEYRLEEQNGRYGAVNDVDGRVNPVQCGGNTKIALEVKFHMCVYFSSYSKVQEFFFCNFFSNKVAPNEVIIVRYIADDYICQYVCKASSLVEEENSNCCEVEPSLEHRDCDIA